MDATFKNRLKKICHILDTESATDIILLDMRRTCTWTDCLIVATARNPIHLNHLAKLIRDCMALGKNGNDEKWCMLDGGDIVVSLMEADTRNFYALEELWYESERMEMQMD